MPDVIQFQGANTMAIMTTYSDLRAYSLEATKKARESVTADSEMAKSVRIAYERSGLSGQRGVAEVVEALVHGFDGNESFKIKGSVPRFVVYKVMKNGEEKLYFKNSGDAMSSEFEYATDEEVAKKFDEDEKFKEWAMDKYSLFE